MWFIKAKCSFGGFSVNSVWNRIERKSKMICLGELCLDNIQTSVGHQNIQMFLF